MTSRTFTIKTTDTEDTSISIIDLKDLQDVDLEEGVATRKPTPSERLHDVDRKTFAFAGYIFWAMIIVVGAATVGILVTQKNTRKTEIPVPTSSAPPTHSPTSFPTRTPDSGLGMAIVQGFESKLGGYAVESALAGLGFANTDVLDGILELGRRIEDPPAILGEEQQEQQQHLQAMQIATEINNKAFSLRTSSGNDISSNAASTLQSDLTTLRDRLDAALNDKGIGLFASLTTEQRKDMETYRNYFVNVFAQSVAAYEGLAKKLEVQWERDCPGISLEPPTPAPIPSYTYSGPSGNYACRGGFLEEGAQSDPLRGKYFDIAGGITTLSSCQKACDARYDCLGIEFGYYDGHRCELWKKPIVSTVPSSYDFTCKRKQIPSSKALIEYHGSANVACRGGFSNEGSPDDPNASAYYEVYSESSESNCRNRCTSNSKCYGIEFKPGYCEVWTRRPKAAEPNNGYVCKRKVSLPDPAFAPQPPQPQETCKWYHISSDALNKFFNETKESVRSMYSE